VEQPKPEINSKKIRLALDDIEYARDRVFSKIVKVEEESNQSKKKRKRKPNANANNSLNGSFNNTMDLGNQSLA